MGRIILLYSNLQVKRISADGNHQYLTFKQALSGKTNRATVVSFSGNITDNPFNGNIGYALVFHDGLIHSPTIFDAIALLPNESTHIQYARIRI